MATILIQSLRKLRSRVLLFAVLLVGSASLLNAQSQQTASIEVMQDRLLSIEGLSYPLVEPHLAVDPKDPKHLVVGTMMARTLDLSVLDCAAFASFDGGISWNRHDFGLETCGDPWMAVTADQAAIFAALGEGKIVVFRSEDGGRTWPREPVTLEGAHDHETMILNPEDGTLYLISGESFRDQQGRLRAGIFVSRSSDQGRSFQHLSTTTPSNLSYEPQNPLILSDGRLLIPYQDHHRWDGRRLERRRSWLLVSTDGGQTFSESRLITEGCNRQGPVSWPSLISISAEGPYHNRLFWVCEEEGFNGILIHISEDGGETWSDRTRIDGGPETNAWTKTPSLAVSSDAVLAVAWYDRRDDPERNCQHMYVTASVDGGSTFLPAVRASSEPSCPDGPGNGDVAARFPGGGDYSGLVSTGPGQFLLVWADSRDGVYRLHTTEMRVVK